MFSFKLVTPSGVAYQDDIEKVSVPTMAGDIEILEGHNVLVSVVASGELTVHKGKGESTPLAVSGGVVEVREGGEVYVLADMAIRADEIDVKKAEEARARAEELLKEQKNVEDVDFARIQAMIDREMTKINVGNKYRK
jgi:F-type H+-transporting ATPase subunit epsilon